MEVSGDDQRTFKVKFSEEGADKLADRLTLVLKEYMGDDFVDQFLVRYVIVLLGNGRSKEEVKDELDVFLGDKCESFVAWLWDHLASHVDQYTEATEPSANETAKPKPDTAEFVDRIDPQKSSVEHERENSNKSTRSRHKRGWKGLLTDGAQPPPPLRSTVTDDVQKEERVNRNSLRRRQRTGSPDPPLSRKRDRPEEQHHVKKEVSAPRRLLQFAVREAVATARPSNSLSEPVRKRLRSVVSTSESNGSEARRVVPISESNAPEAVHPRRVVSNSVRDAPEAVHPRRMRSVARLPNPMAAAAIKAVAEAAEDVRKTRTGNVFDRLGRGVDVKESIEQESKVREAVVQDDEYDDYNQINEEVPRRYTHMMNYRERFKLNRFADDRGAGLTSDPVSDNEAYDDVHLIGHRDMDASEIGISANEVDDSCRMQYSVAQDTDESMCQSRKKDDEKPVSEANTKHKIVNISVNVNTWKPPHYQPQGEMVQVEARKSAQGTETAADNANVRAVKENNKSLTVLGNGKRAAVAQKESQNSVASAPGSYPTGHPLEDADSRTISVNNVHFAATKDTLSRHFNKFGEVLKVLVLTDATGHPKGSAYVEFMRKEAAENALSLDGTSFMSRIIKVVKKSSVQQEANPMVMRSRVARASSYAVPRYAHAPFPRVFPGAYRARPPVKLGARSMQWKRDAPQTSTESAPSSSGNAASVLSVGRGLTYVRPEFKPVGNPGGA